VDGSIQAQPLYVPNVTVAGKGVHNVLYVVTMNDVLYAFDAITIPERGLLWSVDFRNPGAGSRHSDHGLVGFNDGNIVGNVASRARPSLIELQHFVLVARTKESQARQPTMWRGSTPSTSRAEVKSSVAKVIQAQCRHRSRQFRRTLSFDPLMQNQRSSLALVNGTILFAWHRMRT